MRPTTLAERYEEYGDAVTTYTAVSATDDEFVITDTELAEELARNGWRVTAVTEGRV